VILAAKGGIEGGSDALDALADYLEELAAEADLDEPGEHTHLDHDWSPPLGWLAGDSEALMIEAATRSRRG
jgi:hypothetical protein